MRWSGAPATATCCIGAATWITTPIASSTARWWSSATARSWRCFRPSSASARVTSHGGLTYAGLISSHGLARRIDAGGVRADRRRLSRAGCGAHRLQGGAARVPCAIPPRRTCTPCSAWARAWYGATCPRSSRCRKPFRFTPARAARRQQGEAGRHRLQVGADPAVFPCPAFAGAAQAPAVPDPQPGGAAPAAVAFPASTSCCTRRAGTASCWPACLVYDFGRVVHTQYLAASEEGRHLDALSLLLAELIGDTYADRRYFCFGISTEQAGPGAEPRAGRRRRNTSARAPSCTTSTSGRCHERRDRWKPPRSTSRSSACGEVNARYADELKAAAARVIDSGWYVLGDELAAFEREFAAYCGVRHAVGVGNGLDALSLILRGYRELGVIAEGDEVIVPGNTFIASFLAITREPAGAGAGGAGRGQLQPRSGLRRGGHRTAHARDHGGASVRPAGRHAGAARRWPDGTGCC